MDAFVNWLRDIRLQVWSNMVAGNLGSLTTWHWDYMEECFAAFGVQVFVLALNGTDMVHILGLDRMGWDYTYRVWYQPEKRREE